MYQTPISMQYNKSKVNPAPITMNIATDPKEKKCREIFSCVILYCAAAQCSFMPPIFLKGFLQVQQLIKNGLLCLCKCVMHRCKTQLQAKNNMSCYFPSFVFFSNTWMIIEKGEWIISLPKHLQQHSNKNVFLFFWGTEMVHCSQFSIIAIARMMVTPYLFKLPYSLEVHTFFFSS